MPPRLVPGGRYSLALAFAVAISKYADHLPLERQVEIMKREGLVVDSQALCNPAHLFVGSHADNMQDMARNGRDALRSDRGARARALAGVRTARCRASRRARAVRGRDALALAR